MAYNHYILVCGGTGCESSGSVDIYENLKAAAKEFGVEDQVQIVKTGCFGFCEKGPIVKVLPEDSFYVEVKPEDAREIIAEQIVKGREVPRLLYSKEKKSITDIEDIQFYQKQLRIVLRNCGVINPEDITEYIARDGYAALEKVLFDMTPEQVLEEISKLEKENIICAYHTLINWEKTDIEKVSALIEVKVTPQRGQGFDRIAERIYNYPEVKSVYLLSGGYDLLVTLEEKSLKEIAAFVSDKLSTLDSVLSTATHFILKKYKDHGTIINKAAKDEREVITP